MLGAKPGLGLGGLGLPGQGPLKMGGGARMSMLRKDEPLVEKPEVKPELKVIKEAKQEKEPPARVDEPEI